MSVPSTVRRARRMAERHIMIDHGVITEPSSGAGSVSAGGSVWTPDASTPIYDGPMGCTPFGEGDDDVFADAEITESTYVIRIPAGVSTVRPNHRVKLTSSKFDEMLVDASFRVVTVSRGSFRPTRDLLCELVESA